MEYQPCFEQEAGLDELLYHSLIACKLPLFKLNSISVACAMQVYLKEYQCSLMKNGNVHMNGHKSGNGDKIYKRE